jgi:hypothetical protein
MHKRFFKIKNTSRGVLCDKKLRQDSAVQKSEERMRQVHIRHCN